jgi:dTDP-4-dehydrorhamnose reductase
MKILLTGAHGQVGWELARRAPKRGFAVEATDVDVFDITDLRAVDGPSWSTAPPTPLLTEPSPSRN